MKTLMTPKIERKLHSIDASGRILGNLAVEVANILRGKDKVDFVHHLDVGDSVELLNYDKIKFTGRKLEQKTYYRHSGYIGGLKEIKLKDLFLKNPQKVIYLAVSGMLPHNRLKKGWLKRLKFATAPKEKSE